MSVDRREVVRSRRQHRSLSVAAWVGAFIFVIAPLVALLQRAAWSRLVDDLTSHDALNAMRVSLVSSLGATALSMFLGIPLAVIIANCGPRLRDISRAALTVPLVIPPVVGGIAMLFAFGRRGLVGQYLHSWFGIELPFTLAGVVLAEAFVAMPFLVLTIEGALRGLDGRAEEAAATLGGSRWYTLWNVTLPSIGPSIAAGTLLCWARALGEFGATITFAGNFPGTTQSLPLAVFLKFEGGDASGAISLSVVLLIVSVAALVVGGRFARRNETFGQR